MQLISTPLIAHLDDIEEEEQVNDKELHNIPHGSLKDEQGKCPLSQYLQLASAPLTAYLDGKQKKWGRSVMDSRQ